LYLQPTLDECTRFSREYGYLVSFLVEFLDLEEEVKSLQDMLSIWLRTEEPVYYSGRRKIVEEGRAFMQQNDLPWTLISDTTNRVFETKEETYAWLTDALNQIEATLRS